MRFSRWLTPRRRQLEQGENQRRTERSRSTEGKRTFGNGLSVGPSFAENWVTAVAGRIAAVHAEDYDGAVNTHTCCGLGDVDWEGTFAALRAAGYDGFLTVRDATARP